MHPMDRRSTSYYRTLYARYGINDAFLQTRTQRRALGALLDKIDSSTYQPAEQLPHSERKKIRRVFRKASGALKSTCTIGALLLMMQSPAAYPEITSQLKLQSGAEMPGDYLRMRRVLTDDDNEPAQAVASQVQSVPNMSLHLLARPNGEENCQLAFNIDPHWRLKLTHL
jgi:hypothetical protein